MSGRDRIHRTISPATPRAAMPEPWFVSPRCEVLRLPGDLMDGRGVTIVSAGPIRELRFAHLINPNLILRA